MTSSLENENDLLILIWLGRYHEHESGSPALQMYWPLQLLQI